MIPYDLPHRSKANALVMFEADEIVAAYRATLEGKSTLFIDYERLAQGVLERAGMHIHGRGHAKAVVGELRRRASQDAFERAARFVEKTLFERGLS